MAKNKKLYFFVGTTAELIKLSPVMRQLKRRRVGFKIISSNQNTLHFDELKPIIGRQAAYYTFVMKKITGINNIYIRFLWWVVKSFGNYLLYFLKEFKNVNKKEVCFIVHGDTITALIGAFIAKLCRVRLVHIESGLRSFNFFEPFPEEISRFVVSWLADVHFCPNRWAVENLKFRRGVKINTFNNTIGESTALALKARGAPKKVKGLSSGKYFVLVVHRQEHTLFNKEMTKKVIDLMTGYADKKLKCVFVMHQLTHDYLKSDKKLYAKIRRNPNIITPPRLGYLTFVNLLKNSEFIATDGGTNQEEAYYLGKPCLILRKRTERIEGIYENAVLYGGDLSTAKAFVANYKSYKRKRVTLRKLPSRIIVDALLDI